MTDVRPVLARQRQLDALSYVLTGALLLALVAIGYALVTEGGTAARATLLADPIVSGLLICLLLAFSLYLDQQRRKLRDAIAERDVALIKTQNDLTESVEQLTFAHEAADIMVSSRGGGVSEVLARLADHFAADAAGVVADDLTVFAPDPTIEEDASADIMNVATNCVASRKPVAVGMSATGARVMAVPLRAEGHLQYVCAVWRRDRAFDSSELQGLVLVGRILELGLENHILVGRINGIGRKTRVDPAAYDTYIG